MITQTVETKPAIDQKLQLRAKMAVENYATAKRIYEQAKEAMDICKHDVQVVYELAGEKTLQVEGSSVTLVCPVSTTLDEKALLRQGVQLAQIEAAKVTKPGTPYLRVTLAKGMSR